ncbi:SurA N-terminal domain-containing protein [Oceanobacillus sp. CAU 1775]
MKKQLMLIAVILLALFLVACSDDEADEVNEDENVAGEEQAQPEFEITEDEKADEESAVVSVNGTEILGDKYNNIYQQLKTMLHMYGQDTSDLEMLKSETIAILVEQELIRQDATEQGIEVTEEETQAQIDTIVEENGEEALATMLEQNNLSEEDFREQLTNDLVTLKYIETEFDVEVTDEEVQEQYDLLKEENEELGEFEEYEEVIRQNINDEKQREMLETRVNELREVAEVETLI